MDVHPSPPWYGLSRASLASLRRGHGLVQGGPPCGAPSHRGPHGAPTRRGRPGPVRPPRAGPRPAGTGGPGASGPAACSGARRAVPGRPIPTSEGAAAPRASPPPGPPRASSQTSGCSRSRRRAGDGDPPRSPRRVTGQDQRSPWYSGRTQGRCTPSGSRRFRARRRVDEPMPRRLWGLRACRRRYRASRSRGPWGRRKRKRRGYQSGCRLRAGASSSRALQYRRRASRASPADVFAQGWSVVGPAEPGAGSTERPNRSAVVVSGYDIGRGATLCVT